MFLSSIRSGGGEQNSSSKKTGLRPAVEKKQMMMMKKTAVGCERDETVGSRTKQLEVDLRRVKDSEMKMLESLMSQTKQLAETKIELEEAKLEIGILRDTIRSSRNVPKAKPSESESEFSQQEIERLKNELKLAVGAEEKSKKAMDDLAAALKEVAWEANQAKEKLLVAETQLLDKRSEVESSKAGLRLAEEELAKALEEVARTKMEAEESAVRWNAEQEGLKACMRLLEEEIKAGKQDNGKLIEAEKGWRNEVSNMKDIMKHALKEATMAKEALEISRNDDKISTTNPESDGGRRLKTNGDIRSESVRYPPTYSQRTTRKDTGFGSTRFGSYEFSSGQTSRHNINIQSTTNLNSPADNSNSKADLKKKHMFRKFADILRRRGK